MTGVEHHILHHPLFGLFLLVVIAACCAYVWSNRFEHRHRGKW